MCDETESSEPLGDLGSREVVVVGGGLKMGTGKYQHRGVKGGGRTGRNGCWDTSHYNFNHPGAEGLGSPHTGGQKAQENLDGKEERKSKKWVGRQHERDEKKSLLSKDWKSNTKLKKTKFKNT